MRLSSNLRFALCRRSWSARFGSLFSSANPPVVVFLLSSFSLSCSSLSRPPFFSRSRGLARGLLRSACRDRLLSFCLPADGCGLVKWCSCTEVSRSYCSDRSDLVWRRRFPPLSRIRSSTSTSLFAIHRGGFASRVLSIARSSTRLCRRPVWASRGVRRSPARIRVASWRERCASLPVATAELGPTWPLRSR